MILALPYLGNSKSKSILEVAKLHKDSSKVSYEINGAISFGGDSKFALFLPKFNLLRKHRFDKMKFYYGMGLGIHGGFVAGYGSLSGIIGIERRFLEVASSISHFRTTKINIDGNEINGPFSQNLFNLKFGIRIAKVKVKIVRSFLINEKVPIGQKRISLLDLGKINGKIWGIEIQLKLS